jgi:hypothetical protein
MDFILAALAITIGVLLFAIGYLLGERKTIKPAATVQQPQVQAASQPVINQVPKAPRSQTSTNNDPIHHGMRVVSPREAIMGEMMKRDGVVRTPPVEKIPVEVANEFMQEAGAVVANTAAK